MGKNQELKKETKKKPVAQMKKMVVGDMRTTAKNSSSGKNKPNLIKTHRASLAAPSERKICRAIQSGRRGSSNQSNQQPRRTSNKSLRVVGLVYGQSGGQSRSSGSRARSSAASTQSRQIEEAHATLGLIIMPHESIN